MCFESLYYQNLHRYYYSSLVCLHSEAAQSSEFGVVEEVVPTFHQDLHGPQSTLVSALDHLVA